MTSTLIFGGTFDPVHYGHIRSARLLLDFFEEARLVMIPCQVPPHRPQPAVNAWHRANMLNLAVSEDQMICVDDCELHREGKSFTFDTLKLYRARFPDEPLFFVLGYDSWVTLTTWYRWQELTDLAHLIVLTRPGGRIVESEELRLCSVGKVVDLDAISCNSGNVIRLTLEQFDISATRVREALVGRQDIAEWVPVPVMNYIAENNLYRDIHVST